MNRFFNTAGLCFPERHYMVDPLTRLDKVEELIQKQQYFTIHAPRQTGKTTYVYALARRLNNEGNYIVLTTSFERAGYHGIPIERANTILIDSIYQSACDTLPQEYRPENPHNMNFLELKNYLQHWSRSQEKPIVLLVDEIDALMDEVLISVLRQFRDGYQSRPSAFPSSIALVGLRDVRDYKARIREERNTLGTASPFNVKAKALFINNFSRQEVFALLEQHTQDTQQVFPLEVKEEIFRLTGGQPWLVNALANEIVFEILSDDFSKAITMAVLAQAKNQLILRQDTHLDSLADKLYEKRVQQIVHLIINGDPLPFDIVNEHIRYCRDLGLISQKSPIEFANPIYAEIIPRFMAFTIQESLPGEVQTPFFIDAQGQLNMEKLLKQFQDFYRMNIEAWLSRGEFKESAHQLLLMAFLQRVINSGGEIVREMAVGNGRLDMLVTFHDQRFAMEIKIKRDKSTQKTGLIQLSNYLDRLGLQQGYLIIFDPKKGNWDKKIFYKEADHEGKRIFIVGL